MAQRRSKLRNPKDKDARAVVFQLERVKGKTITEIAEAYNCHPNTVAKYVNRAREHGLIVGYARDLINEKLLPLTLAVYESHLKEGNLEAAQDILHGMGVLQRTANIKHESADPEDTLEAFREKFFQARQASAVDVQPLPPSPPPVDTLQEPPAALPGLLDDPAAPARFDPADLRYEPIEHPHGRLADLHDQSDESDE